MHNLLNSCEAVSQSVAVMQADDVLSTVFSFHIHVGVSAGPDLQAAQIALKMSGSMCSFCIRTESLIPRMPKTASERATSPDSWTLSSGVMNMSAFQNHG